MRLENQQKDAIERGWAMVYVAADGSEHYIESVLNAYGEPSPKYKGMVYVFDADGDLEFDAHMFESLDAAKAACDASADDGWTMAATEAARALGVSRMRVNQLLNDGILEGYKEGGAWRVYRHSVDDRRKKLGIPDMTEFVGNGWYRIGWSDGGQDWTNDGPMWLDYTDYAEEMTAVWQLANETHLPYAEYLGDGDEPIES